MQLNLGNGLLLANGGRPTSNESEGSDMKLNLINLEGNNGKPLKDDLLNKYMQQNEGLRAENAQLHQQRERLIHDHELVCRENDRLRKRLSMSDLEDGFMESGDEISNKKSSKKLFANNNKNAKTISSKVGFENGKNESKKKAQIEERKTSPNRKSEITGKNKQLMSNPKEDNHNNSKPLMVNGSNLSSNLDREKKIKDSNKEKDDLEVRGTAATKTRFGRR